jgi:hypothetical protein
MTPVAIRNEIAYIHANPVRAGLCGVPSQWKWSSVHEHMSAGAGPVPIDREHLRAVIG